MKVAFVNSGILEKTPQSIPNAIMGKALSKHNIEIVYYVPVRRLGQAEVTYERNKSFHAFFIPCSFPFVSRYSKHALENKSIAIRRFVDFLEYAVYLMRIQRRLSQDKVDAYIILHLWDSTIALLNPILSLFRPTAILWMGHSLRWHAQFKWLYNFLVPLYKLVLRKPVILTPMDVEQKICLFKILKIPRRNVYRFNPCIVDEKIFYEMEKETCAKIVGFDTKRVNILTMLAIRDPKEIERARSSDYQKDIFRVVEIFRFLVKNDPKVHLHTVGVGPGFEKLKTIISHYNLQEKITIHGWIENEARPIFVNAVDLIINPYPLIEFNDATAIFEAFLCGKPVVAFKRYSWVPSEHKGGFLIDRDPRKGAEEIALRLDRAYLANKSREAKRIPYEHNVVMDLWGKELSKILTEMLEGG